MSNSRVRQNPVKTGRRKTIWDSRRRGLNPRYLRTLVRAWGWAFLPKVCINKIFHPRVEINHSEQLQVRLITRRENPWNVGVVERNICWGIVCIENRIMGGSTTSKRLPQSMMWLGACHKFVHPWITDKLTTKLQWWRWKVRFQTIPFPF